MKAEYESEERTDKYSNCIRITLDGNDDTFIDSKGYRQIWISADAAGKLVDQLSLALEQYEADTPVDRENEAALHGDDLRDAEIDRSFYEGK